MKDALVARIRELPAEALKSTTLQLLSAGVSGLALPAIKALLGA